MNRILITTLAIGATLAPLTARPADDIVLKSIKTTLPYSDREFPGGASAASINDNCRACHSADFVLTQPNLPKAAWDGVVKKMIKVMKAPVSPEDATAIVNYLTETKGVNQARRDVWANDNVQRELTVLETKRIDWAQIFVDGPNFLAHPAKLFGRED